MPDETGLVSRRSRHDTPETTLRFQDHAFQPWPWTYADYRQPEVLAFLGEAREYYRQRLASRDALGPEGGSDH